jgi:hypothetical protein
MLNGDGWKSMTGLLRLIICKFLPQWRPVDCFIIFYLCIWQHLPPFSISGVLGATLHDIGLGCHGLWHGLDGYGMMMYVFGL